MSNQAMRPSGTIVSLRVAADDAQRLATNFGDNFRPQQFVELDPFSAYVRPVEGAPFPFRLSIAAPTYPDCGYRNSVIAKCRERFATPRDQIEQKLRRWMEADSRGTPR